MSYRIGTISVTNGSKAVVGTNTLFATIGVSAGDQLTLVDANGLPTGSMYEVASVTDNTHLTLLQNYQGTTASGQSYAIIDMAGDMTVANFARRLAQFYADINSGASPTVKGLVKLYAALGSNTDGALSQQALNNIINANNGIAGLDGSGKLDTQRLYTNSANNVAGLDTNAKVPYANLPIAKYNLTAYTPTVLQGASSLVNSDFLYSRWGNVVFLQLVTWGTELNNPDNNTLKLSLPFDVVTGGSHRVIGSTGFCNAGNNIIFAIVGNVLAFGFKNSNGNFIEITGNTFPQTAVMQMSLMYICAD